MTVAPDASRQVVGKAVRTLAVKRLARGFLPLVGLIVTAGVAGLAGVSAASTTAATMAGAALTAGALLVLGQHAVREAFGLPPTGGWRWAGLARVVPWAFALWVLAVPGVGAGRVALSARAWLPLGLAVLNGVLGARVLLDAVRVGELERLARTMATAAPEEEGAP